MKNPKINKLIEELSNKKDALLDKLTNSISNLPSNLKQPTTEIVAGALALLTMTGIAFNHNIADGKAVDIPPTKPSIVSTATTTFEGVLDNVIDKETLVTGTTASETTTKETTTKESTTKAPETTTKPTTTKAPETTTKAPETTTKAPETTTKAQETTTQPNLRAEDKDLQGNTDGYSRASFYGSAKVMTFNVRYVQEEKNSTNNWDNRRDILVNQIEENNPDIIGFQEIQLDHLEYFKDNLDGYTYYYFAKTNNPNHCTQAIFFKTQKYRCTDSGKFWLSETPDKISKGWDADSYRIATYCTLQEIATANKFNFYNIHLDHLGQTAREKGAQLIVDHVNQTEIPAIIVGDFNAGEDNKMYGIMSSNFDDAKYVADDMKNNTNTYNAWNQPARLGRSPIDFIFFTKGDFEVESYEVLNDDLGAEDNYADKVYASDHFAVVSEIEY